MSRSESTLSKVSVVLLLVILSPLPPAVFGQQRDAQALTILTRTLAAGGGSTLLNTIRDFTAIGKVTYYWDPQVSGTVRIKGRGQGQFRIDAALPQGVRSIVASNGDGSIREVDGRVEIISRQAALDLANMTLPSLSVLKALQDPSITIIYTGLVFHLGKPLHDIRMQKTYSAVADPNGAEAKRSARDLYIDPNTFLVAGISTHADQRGGRGIHEVVFGNYQSLDGVNVPLWITESAGDQSLLTFQLSQVTFNTGFSDTDFGQ